MDSESTESQIIDTDSFLKICIIVFLSGLVLLFVYNRMWYKDNNPNDARFRDSLSVSTIVDHHNENNNDRIHKCVIPNIYYPEIEELVKNKELIMDELIDIIKSGLWSTLEKSSEHDNSRNLFGLILEGETIEENVSRCLNTYKLIKDISGLINAGFSCLEPYTETPYHNDKDDSYYRVHVPLIVPDVPDEDIRLDVYDNNNKIKLNWKTDYFVFDDTCFHQAFNNTDRHRIVLLLDIERRV